MSNIGDFLHFPATNDCTRKPSSATAGDSLRQAPVSSSDTRIPLQNLSAVRSRMDSLQQFLSVSVKTNTLIGKDQMAMVSAEIATAIHQIIVNGAALLASSQSPNISPQSDHIAPNPKPKPPEIEITSPNVLSESDLKFNISDAADTEIPNTNQICINKDKAIADLKLEADDEVMSNESEIIELDAVELLAEQIHFCDICGKGFKRDANLRMHMRAHGNQFKTPEALAKPERYADLNPRRTRFSCPFLGCNRNKLHKKFRPLKSVICVKNHFKRSHCPKMYSCNRCNKKTFSVVADLKSHLKHCGETKWKCSCGTTFSRKDKLFGHMALFEGHMPAVSEEDERAKGVAAVLVLEDEGEEDRFVKEGELGANFLDNGFFDGLLEGFDSIENYSGLAGDGMDSVS